jgi:hypothetical protein
MQTISTTSHAGSLLQTYSGRDCTTKAVTDTKIMATTTNAIISARREEVGSSKTRQISSRNVSLRAAARVEVRGITSSFPGVGVALQVGSMHLASPPSHLLKCRLPYPGVEGDLLCFDVISNWDDSASKRFSSSISSFNLANSFFKLPSTFDLHGPIDGRPTR